MPYIGKTPTVGNFQVCDAISVVNGQAAYTLQVGGPNVAPESANHMLVSLNGILQKPGSSFTISGSTMTFASNLATGDVIDFVQILGNVLDLGTPSDDTVTAAKLNNDIISGQTALAATPADTDELLISDAGTIKRIDYSYIKGLTSISNPIVKAWCKWTGTTIGDSYNISSVANDSTGQYVLTFSTAMDNANYATVASLYGQNFANSGFELEAQSTTTTTLRAKNFSSNSTNNMGSGGYGCAIIIGDNASL
jgi:hypothetical protein